MRWFMSMGFGLLLALPVLQADGLVHRLPEDGASAKFDLEMTMNVQGMDKTITGHMVMASVGKADVEGKACRWIEFKLQMDFDGKEKIVVAKALIPEKAIKPGENPGTAMIRAWLKEDGEPKELKDLQGQDAGPLPVFLSGPLLKSKKLAKEAMDNKALGKIEAEGVSGSNSFDQGKEKIEVKMENRLHPKAPFGVVRSKIEFQIFRNGEARQQGTLVLKLIEVGKGAKSELPDKK